VDANGNVFVADSANNRVQKFTNDGTFVATWGSSGSADGQFDTILGIAVDANGNVFVTDFGNSRIQKFTNAGTFLAKWGSSGSGDGQFNNPYGVAVDADGNVFVIDSLLKSLITPLFDRVQKFTNDGNLHHQVGHHRQ
jgi:tripartite motif-containing protein 71